MNDTEKKASVKLNVFVTVLKTFVGLLFPLITFPYSSRILHPEGIGKISFSLSIVYYCAVIAVLGVPSYGVREAAKIRNDKKALTKLVKELFLINTISTFSVYIILFFCITFIPKLADYKTIIIICSSLMFFNLIGFEWFFTALEKFTYMTIRSFIFQSLSVIALFVFVKTEEDYLKYAFINIFTTVGAYTLNFFLIFRYLQFGQKQKLEIKKHLKPILILFAISATLEIYNSLDTTMLGFLSTDESVGIYSAATKINRLVLMAATAMLGVLLPRLSYVVQHGDKDEFHNLIKKFFDVMFLFAVPSTLGLCVVGKSTILLLSGEKFIEAVPVMRIMNPIIIILGTSSLLGHVFLSLNKEKFTFHAILIGVLVNLILNTILIPKFQAIGAAIGTIAAESVVTIVELFLIRKIINLRYVLVTFVKYLGNSIIMIIPVIIVVKFVDNVFSQLILAIITGIVIYLLLLVIEKNQIIVDLYHTVQSKIQKRVC